MTRQQLEVVFAIIIIGTLAFWAGYAYGVADSYAHMKQVETQLDRR